PGPWPRRTVQPELPGGIQPGRATGALAVAALQSKLSDRHGRPKDRPARSGSTRTARQGARPPRRSGAGPVGEVRQKAQTRDRPRDWPGDASVRSGGPARPQVLPTARASLRAPLLLLAPPGVARLLALRVVPRPERHSNRARPFALCRRER